MKQLRAIISTFYKHLWSSVLGWDSELDKTQTSHEGIYSCFNFSPLNRLSLGSTAEFSFTFWSLPSSVEPGPKWVFNTCWNDVSREGCLDIFLAFTLASHIPTDWLLPLQIPECLFPIGFLHLLWRETDFPPSWQWWLPKSTYYDPQRKAFFLSFCLLLYP